ADKRASQPVSKAHTMRCQSGAEAGKDRATDSDGVLNRGFPRLKGGEIAVQVDGRHIDHHRTIEYLVADRARSLVDVDRANQIKVFRKCETGRNLPASTTFQRNAA